MARTRPFPVPVAQLTSEMRQWTDAALARRYGISAKTLRNWRLRFGIPAQEGLRRRTTPGLQERLVEALRTAPPDDTSYVTLGQRLGVTKQAIHQTIWALAARGVVERGSSTRQPHWRLAPRYIATPTEEA